jgi:hypothetical protein
MLPNFVDVLYVWKYKFQASNLIFESKVLTFKFFKFLML